MPDVTPTPAQPVLLVMSKTVFGAGLGRPHHSWSETAARYDGAEPTHIAHPLDATSVAAQRLRIREIVASVVVGQRTWDEATDEILAALSLETEHA